MDNLILAIAIIGMLGVGAQRLAWRLALPAIVLIMLFGEFYRPMIAIAVAVILFESGLTLNFADIRGLTKGVRSLVFPGFQIASFLAVVFGFALGRFAAAAFGRGWVLEYLKPPVLLALVLFGFEFANLLQEEAGLLTVVSGRRLPVKATFGVLR